MRKFNFLLLVSLCICVLTSKIQAQSALGLSFDGVDDRATIPNSTAYNFGTSYFTVEAWIKADVNQPNAEPTIFSKRDATGSAGLQIYLSSGKLAVRMGTSQLGFANNTDLRDGQCHHIAVTRTSLGILTYFIDGAQLSAVSNATANITTTHDIWIGMDEFSSASSKFKGVIHDVRVWNRNISNAQIASNTTVYQSGYEEFLAGYWQMNNGSGQAISDSKPASPNNGYLGATASTESSDPTYVTGCMCATTSTISSSGL